MSKVSIIAIDGSSSHGAGGSRRFVAETAVAEAQSVTDADRTFRCTVRKMLIHFFLRCDLIENMFDHAFIQ